MGSIHSREEPRRLPALRRTSFSLAPASDICGLEVAVVFEEEREHNPNASQADIIKRLTDNREAIRQRVVNILTPEQLTKWDSEVTKAKEFLGLKIAA
jgi:hypothetical protein